MRKFEVPLVTYLELPKFELTPLFSDGLISELPYLVNKPKYLNT